MSGISRRRLGGFLAICLGASVLGVSAVAAQPGGRDVRPSSEAGSAIGPIQPVVTAPPPRSRHSLPFGSLRVSPTAIVAGAPDQDVRVTVDPSRALTRKIRVRIYRPARPDSARFGRNITRVGLASRMLELDGSESRRLTLSDLNRPPGRYRLDLVDPRTGRVIERSSLLVYGQNRLPPDKYAAQAAAERAGSAAASGSTGERALPSPSTNNNVSNNSGDNQEVYTAVEFDNSQRVIAASNPSSGNPPAWISNNSMKPGTQVLNALPSSTLMPPDEGGGTQNLSLCCDPALAADDRGNLWYSVLTTGSSSHIIINRAAGPSATTFNAQNTAIRRVTTGQQDKNMIGVDSWASSPKRYRLYAVWTENPGQNIVISECDGTTASNCDNPTNWSEPVDVTGPAGGYIYASVAAAPNGDVYVAWVDYNQDHIEINRCLAGENCTVEANWNEESNVDTDLDPGSASALPFFCSIISAPGGRVSASTYVDVGPDGRVYVVWSELRNNNTTRCSESATDRTFDSYIAAGAANTFPAANTGVRLTDDTATALNDHFFPTLAADPSAAAGTIEASFYSTKADATRETTHQYYVISTNGGVSYGSMQQFTTAASDYSGANSDGFDYGDYEGSDVAQGIYYPAWTDNRAAGGGDAELFMLTPPSGPLRTLTVNLAGTGSGTVTGTGINCPGDCTETYADGSNVVLTASPSLGSSFTNWTTCDNPSGSQCTMNMTADKSVTANFNAEPNKTLTVSTAGTGGGTVTGTGINCPGDCTESYAHGTLVSLSAAAGSGSAFNGWGVDCGGVGACNLTMSANRNVSATFTLIPLGGGDTAAPRTKIVQGPNRKTTKRRAKFKFSSNEPGSTFKCKRDKRAFKPCTSPKKLKNLDLGRHRFRVKATDAAGNTDPTPAKRRWRVVEP
ncbi:MAG: hypothetical protein AABM29_02160 [Actinomycetota bacterium]